MATVTTRPQGRTWYGRRAYSVVVSDPTGTLTFHGYRARKHADLLGSALRVIIGNRPVGALTVLLGRELLLIEPSIGQEWTKRA